MCCIQREQEESGSPTLGFFQPHQIESLIIESDTPNWSPQQLARLRQFPLWEEVPESELEKIPYTFSYRYRCDEKACNSHTQMCDEALRFQLGI